jgi:hypothetical protein
MKNKTYYVEGTDWKVAVKVNPLRHVDKASQLFEAGALAIKARLNTGELTLGGIVLIEDEAARGETIMVNSYICLNRAGEYRYAQKIRKNFMRRFGQDLAADDVGFKPCK